MDDEGNDRDDEENVNQAPRDVECEPTPVAHATIRPMNAIKSNDETLGVGSSGSSVRCVVSPPASVRI